MTQDSTPQGTFDGTFDDTGPLTGMTEWGQTPVACTRNDANRLAQITQGSASVAFTYDAVGRRTSAALPNGVVVEYGYDAATQLTSISAKKNGTIVGDLIYAYDAIGNVVSVGGTLATVALPNAVTSASYKAAIQLTQWNGQGLTCDANSNLPTHVANTYAGDARDQLASANGFTFSYDGLARCTG